MPRAGKTIEGKRGCWYEEFSSDKTQNRDWIDLLADSRENEKAVAIEMEAAKAAEQ